MRVGMSRKQFISCQARCTKRLALQEIRLRMLISVLMIMLLADVAVVADAYNVNNDDNVDAAALVFIFSSDDG